MSTDGKNLYSYALLIGETDNKGRKILYDYGVSQSTRVHVNLAKDVADVVLDPTKKKSRFT